MSARSFKSMAWVAAVGGAALGCYMVSLNVASERAELAKVEREIRLAQRDIRALQTELGTRGRFQQLEQWNAEVLALSAPMPGQFIDSQMRLASLPLPHRSIDDQVGEVQLASAAMETVPAKPAVAFRPAADPIVDKPLVHRASLMIPVKSALDDRAAPVADAPVRETAKERRTAAAKAVSAEAKEPLTKPAVKAVAAAVPVKSLATAKAPVPKQSPRKEDVASKKLASPPQFSSLLDDGLLREIDSAAGAERKGVRTAR